MSLLLSFVDITDVSRRDQIRVPTCPLKKYLCPSFSPRKCVFSGSHCVLLVDPVNQYMTFYTPTTHHYASIRDTAVSTPVRLIVIRGHEHQLGPNSYNL